MCENSLCNGSVCDLPVVVTPIRCPGLPPDIVRVYVLWLHVRRESKSYSQVTLTISNTGLIRVNGTTTKSGFQSRPHTAYTRRLVNAKPESGKPSLEGKVSNAPPKAK